MRRSREIVGLPVLDLKKGGSIGWVQDLVLDCNKDEVAGILLEGGHLFHTTKGIPRKAIVSVGKDAVTIQEKTLEELRGTRWSEKIGNEVYTQAGDSRGTIEDIFVDDSVKKLVGFEISDGLFADLLHGRGTILRPHVMIDGKDILIVDNQVSPLDQANEGGFQS
ncbi:MULTISPECIES: PRC-barrel domain-containing protein [Desulfosporosinus]|uniref:PRC-barrel domain protein n=1 Tax=Desulfosporosinus acididurans TaxID=476652 RepID=A0A0J1FTY4_9FIRM|nr:MULTISPECIES: PRC-barrel domain-containing protein [Desulfosporosinus]KLU66448.1 PRC-barrel domain protein [Desulfosporosinus acididurans]